MKAPDILFQLNELLTLIAASRLLPLEVDHGEEL